MTVVTLGMTLSTIIAPPLAAGLMSINAAGLRGWQVRQQHAIPPGLVGNGCLRAVSTWQLTELVVWQNPVQVRVVLMCSASFSLDGTSAGWPTLLLVCSNLTDTALLLAPGQSSSRPLWQYVETNNAC